MYPILYDSTNLHYTNLGKGKLTDVLSCEVYEELNGEYSAEFTYPVTGARINDLYNGGTVLIWAPTYDSTFSQAMEWFDIVSHSMEISGVVTFHCQHVSRRLAWSMLLGPTVYTNTLFTNATPAQYGGLTFTHEGSSPVGNTQFTITEPKSLLACLIGDEESCVANFGGEFAFRSKTTSVPETIQCAWTWKTTRGADRGVQIRFGYNMMSFNWERDRTEEFNAYLPYWQDSNGTRIYAPSPYYVTPTTAISPIILQPLDCSGDFETQPTSAQLQTFAQNKLDTETPWIPKDGITVDFLNGVEIDPHSPPITLGDIVHVKWYDAGIQIDQKVISYRFDALQEKYIEMKIGTKQNKYVAIEVEK